jgi:arginine decarboxylase
MDIIVTGGIGTGSTELSAFDAALFDAGVSNYNLIYLSSIIPPGATVRVVDRYLTPEEDFGKRLYVVRAVETTSFIGEHIAAGIGWYKFDGDKGFFVEHHGKGNSNIYSEISESIDKTLGEMCFRRGVKFDASLIHKNIYSSVCTGVPICAISIAVYDYQI